MASLDNCDACEVLLQVFPDSAQLKLLPVVRQTVASTARADARYSAATGCHVDRTTEVFGHQISEFDSPNVLKPPRTNVHGDDKQQRRGCVSYSLGVERKGRVSNLLPR